MWVFFVLLFIALFSSPAWVNNKPEHKSPRYYVQPPKTTFSYQHEDEISFKKTTTNIAGQSITRSTPIFRGTIVEGADNVSDDQESSKILFLSDFPKVRGSFIISPAEALEEAINVYKNSTLKNPFVEKIDGFYEKIWLNHFDELRPVFKCRPPTLSIYNLKDIYIDAQTKEILKIEDSAMFIEAKANLFVYSPDSENINYNDLKQVTLKDLNNPQENALLSGDFVSVRSCCQYFVCPEKGECNEKTRRCVAPGYPNARSHREIIQLPTDTLGLDPLMALPKVINVNTVRCTYIPQARTSMKGAPDSALGFYERPIDEPGYASEMDAFSEVQAYYSISSFFKHIRSLLQDDTWCLRSSAMSCNKDGTPVRDASGNALNPYKVFVNQVVPDIKSEKKDSTDTDADGLVDQLMKGKGGHDNPVVLNKFTRMGNAAFIPALNMMRTTTPRADEILNDLIKPFDHNVFFQGDRDFAYDGDVVFHEFMHAVTTSLVNKLNAMGLNSWGIHSEPGSLNEAWSDYFAAAFTNRSTIGGYAAIKDGYGEASLRNIKNDLRCPENMIGEIHNDGLTWSGALWEIREAVQAFSGQENAIEFDRAVLSSLAQAKTSEDFKTQSEKLLRNIEKRPTLGSKIRALANDILIKRGVKDCRRAFKLSSVDAQNQVTTTEKNLLFVPSKIQIGLKNYAPASSQLEIAIPAGAQSLTLSWRQYLGSNGALMGAPATPESTKNMVPLFAMASFDTPIEWKFKNATATATRAGQEITTEPFKAFFENGLWHLKMDLLPTCEPRTVFVSLLSTDFKYVLENINVNFQVDPALDLGGCKVNGHYFYIKDANAALKESNGCSSTSSTPIIALLILFLIRLRRFKA